MEPRHPTPLDDFLFDLRGYLVIKNAVEPELVDELNRTIDTIPPLKYGEWYGNTQRRDYTASTGLELHNAVELGGPFEELIDHPGWINYVRHYCGEEKSYVEGLFIDECILSVRESGGHHPVHSGGYQGALRGIYHYANGVFRCGQCNIIVALTDVGPGDGATMVIPGSHKSNFPHPECGQLRQAGSDGHAGRGDRGSPEEGGRGALRGWHHARRIEPHESGAAPRHHHALRRKLGEHAFRLRVLAGAVGSPDAGAPQDPAADPAAPPRDGVALRAGGWLSDRAIVQTCQVSEASVTSEVRPDRNLTGLRQSRQPVIHLAQRVDTAADTPPDTADRTR